MNDLRESASPAPRRTSNELSHWASLVVGVLLVALVAGAYGFKTSAGSAQVTSGNPREEALMKAGLDALYTRNDPSAAAASFRQVLTLNPEHYGATFQLATALDRAGKRDEARVYWEKMLPMAEAARDEPTAATARARLQEQPRPPGDEAGLMQAGLDALYKQQRPDAAADDFRKVLERNPAHYGATFQLATALDRAGKPAEARPLWEKVLKMAEGYHDKATAETARARLARNP